MAKLTKEQQASLEAQKKIKKKIIDGSKIVRK